MWKKVLGGGNARRNQGRNEGKLVGALHRRRERIRFGKKKQGHAEGRHVIVSKKGTT